MKFIRYTILLLIIGLSQMLLDFSANYTPEFLYIIAFICSLHTNSRRAVISFFIAGLISDLFTGEHLGIDTFLYTSTAIFHSYFREALSSKSGLIHLLLLGISLLYIYTLRLLLHNFSIPTEPTLILLAHNLILSLLIAPAIEAILELPLICPWQRKSLAF